MGITRSQEVYQRRASGESYVAIALDMGISSARAAQLKRQWERRLIQTEQNERNWPNAKLRAWTINALYRCGITNIGQLQDVIRTKGISCVNGKWQTSDGTIEFHNLGEVCWFEEIFPLLTSIGFDWRAHYQKVRFVQPETEDSEDIQSFEFLPNSNSVFWSKVMSFQYDFSRGRFHQ